MGFVAVMKLCQEQYDSKKKTIENNMNHGTRCTEEEQVPANSVKN